MSSYVPCSRSYLPPRVGIVVTGEVLVDGGRGTSRAGMGDADDCRPKGIGDAVFDRGRGIDIAGRGTGDSGRDLD